LKILDNWLAKLCNLKTNITRSIKRIHSESRGGKEGMTDREAKKKNNPLLRRGVTK